MDLEKFMTEFLEKMKAAGLLTVEAFDGFKEEMKKELSELKKKAEEEKKEVDENVIIDAVMAKMEAKEIAKKKEEDQQKAIDEMKSKQKAEGGDENMGRFNFNVIHSSKSEGKNKELIEAIKDIRASRIVTSATIDSEIDMEKGDAISNDWKRKAKSDTNFDGAANYGPELIQTSFATEVYTRLQAVGDYIHQRFPKVPMPTSICQLGNILSEVTLYGYKNTSPSTDQQTTNTALANVQAETMQTGNDTLYSKSIVGKSNLSYDIIDDTKNSGYDMLAIHKMNHAKKHSEALTDLCINGDDTATHMDGDTNAVTNSHLKLWKGIRKMAKAGSLTVDCSSGGVSLANIKSIRKMMGKYLHAINPSYMPFWLFGIKGYEDINALYESTTGTEISKFFGVQDGQVKKIRGIDALVTTFARENLDIDAAYDAVTSGAVQTKGAFYLVNPAQIYIGIRKSMQVTVTNKPEDDKVIITSKLRGDMLAGDTPSTTYSMLAMGYNYTS